MPRRNMQEPSKKLSTWIVMGGTQKTQIEWKNIGMVTIVKAIYANCTLIIYTWAQARKHTSERFTLALKPRADVTRSPK